VIGSAYRLRKGAAACSARPSDIRIHRREALSIRPFGAATNGKDVTHSDSATFITTRAGTRFHIRPVCTEDDGTIEEFFSQVGPADLRFRLLSGTSEVL
jgi:hypothetical protein